MVGLPLAEALSFCAPPLDSGHPGQPVPLWPGLPPYRMSLDRLTGDQFPGVGSAAAGALRFHAVGDCGDPEDSRFQDAVARGLVEDAAAGAPPAFLYLLGDVVYTHGAWECYPAQFYQPYRAYPAPIVAVPGNHDGDVLPFSGAAPSLTGFLKAFCADPAPPSPDAAGRSSPGQPNPYWTLVTPMATVIGLYTNVPEGGLVDDVQRAWFENELRAAADERAVIVCLHHAPYSADTVHSGSPMIAALLDQAALAAGRCPDLVLAGHVHNYQRFTRRVADRDVVHVVAGAGGAANLYRLGHGAPLPTLPFRLGSVTLETFCDDRHGFLRLDIDRDAIVGCYLTVSSPGAPWRQPQAFDRFVLDLRTKRLVR